MKIKNIEILPIYPKLVARNATHNAHFPNWNLRTVYKVEADNGLIGYGDIRSGPASQKIVEPLIGESPFEFLMNDFPAGLGAALYDLMGKHLDIPAYKLMGQKVREYVSVAAWTKPASPEKLRQEVIRAVAEGYCIMKMHTCAYYDVIEQNRAVEEVAPEGFRMHYDFNWNRSHATVLGIIKQLEQSPVAGWIEDPLPWGDIDGWAKLRARCDLPFIMHNPRLGGGQELIRGAADAYMLAGAIGPSLQAGFAYAAANIPIVLQITGGTLTKALALHLGAVLPTATMHSINLDDQYEDDITTERIPVVEGASPVPEGPGLGFDVDENALAELAAREPTPVPKHVAVLKLRGGTIIYFPSLAQVNVPRLTGRDEGMLRGLTLELWDDDGTEEFKKTYKKCQKEGAYVCPT